MNSMRCGGRRREVEVVGGAMPLAAGCGAIPLEEDGGVMLPRGDDGVTPSRGGAMPLGADGDGAMPVGEDPGAWRRWLGRCGDLHGGVGGATWGTGGRPGAAPCTCDHGEAGC